MNDIILPIINKVTEIFTPNAPLQRSELQTVHLVMVFPLEFSTPTNVSHILSAYCFKIHPLITSVESLARIYKNFIMNTATVKIKICKQLLFMVGSYAVNFKHA